MNLIVLGSSSQGNGYILDNGTEAIVLECGIRLHSLKEALGFDLARVKGVFITHEHQDHAKYHKQYTKAYLPVYASQGTKEALKNDKVIPLAEGEAVKLGGFTVKPFGVKHDAREPFGFMLKHRETGAVLFATDTYYLPYKFKGLNNILLEANYETNTLKYNLEQGIITEQMKNRTLQSHMSLEQCKDTLLANDLSGVNNIVLIHLSDRNAKATHFKDYIHEATDKSVTIATRGLVIPFDKTPF